MNNQKDTQKTDVNTYGQSDVSDIKSLANMSVYDFANKKTEKLVTALYLVSDCMDTDDALKGKLRLLGVELLSDIYKLSTFSPIEKHNYISVSITHIHEVLSFIEIAYTIGFISEMNTAILKKEFASLLEDLRTQQSKDKHFTFTLDEKMFELPDTRDSSQREDIVSYQGVNHIKDMSLNTNKRTSSNTMSFSNKRSPLQNFHSKKTKSESTNMADREERTTKIISLIKDASTNIGKKDISIKDISLAFTDCSEKTIQRDLNSLVLKGTLKKTGAKRWSRYHLGSED